MHVIRRRGWEIPESLATPEHLFLNRRTFLGDRRGGAVAVAGMARLRSASPICRIPTGRSLSGQAQREIWLSTGRSPTRRSTPTTTISTNSAREEHRQGRAGAEAAAMDGQNRRHGGEAARDRHRRPDPQDADGGAALSPPLRRGLVDGDPLERFPLAKLWSIWRKPLARRNMCGWRPSWIRRRAGPAADLVSMALYRRPDHGGGDQRTRLPRHRRLRQAGRRSSTARRCGWRCRGNTASNRSSPSCASPSPTSGRRAFGRPSRRPNTASGPTSIRRCPIRAGARRPRSDRHQRARADPAIQRLRRICRRALQGPGERAALGMTRSRMRKRVAVSRCGRRLG